MRKLLLACWTAGAITFALAKLGWLPSWTLGPALAATLCPTIAIAHGLSERSERKRWGKTP